MWFQQQNRAWHDKHFRYRVLQWRIEYIPLYIGRAHFVLFILVLVYFPSAPPRPPSTTSQLKKTPPLSGFLTLLKNPQAWLILLVNSISSGIPGTWMAMMVTNLTKVTVDGRCLSEEWINILALVSRLCMTSFSILLARFTDILRGHMKITIMVQLALATLIHTFKFGYSWGNIN